MPCDMEGGTSEEGGREGRGAEGGKEEGRRSGTSEVLREEQGLLGLLFIRSC